MSTVPRLGVAARIALGSVVMGLVVATAGIGVGYWALSRQLDVRIAEDLRGRRHLVSHLLSELASLDGVRASDHRFGDLLIGHDDLHLAMADPRTGQLMAAYSDVAKLSFDVLAKSGDGDASIGWRDGNHRYNSIRVVAHTSDGAPVRFYLTQSRDRDDALLSGFLQAATLGLPFLLMIVGGGSWLIVRSGIAPLRTFKRIAQSVGAKSLDRRIAAEELPAELEELAGEFNRMLDRIDAGYQRLQSFSGDLAHELRTPVAILLGRTQVALSQQRTAGELREVLEGNIEELDRLSRLISDILFMAQSEEGRSSLQLERIDLGEEARRVAEYLSIAAEERGLRIEVTGNATVKADKLLVQRAITNLLTNALRHAANSPSISVDVHVDGGNALVSVTNAGEGVPAEHQARIFDRFYRIDAGRARLEGGTGLGLAIVKTIMEAHGGTVGVESHLHRTTSFTLRFPAVPES